MLKGSVKFFQGLTIKNSIKDEQNLFCDLLEQYVQFPNEITSPFYWDCECEDNYIHSKRELVCINCGAKQFEMPDSIKTEVLKFGLQLVPFSEKDLYVRPK